MPTQRLLPRSVWLWLCCALSASALAQALPPAPGPPMQLAEHERRGKTEKKAKKEKHGWRHHHDDDNDERSPMVMMVDPMTGGIVFTPMQQRVARSYYLEPEHHGFVPPGLAKRGGMPPGQLKRWRVGHPLPIGVPYYALPGTLVLQLGPAPVGYRYVRVATDILLIAIGTGMVVDAIEDIVR